MDLRQLRYFIAVAEELSFSRAAERLHVSQPPLSVHVKGLEEDLGIRLFDRSNRGVTLTAAGQVFYDEIRTVLRRLEQARLKAQNAGRGERGTLSIGFVSIADYGVLPPALKRFREEFPQVEVQLHELTTDAQIREIRGGRLDLGIGLGPVEEADLVFETLLRESLLLAAPTGHRLLKASGSGSPQVLRERKLHHSAAGHRAGPVRPDHQPMPREWFRAADQPTCAPDADRDRPRLERHGFCARTVVGQKSEAARRTVPGVARLDRQCCARFTARPG